MGDLGASGRLGLVGRSMLVPLKGVFDAVAFVPGAGSTISPSDGSDGDRDLGCGILRDLNNARGKSRYLLITSFGLWRRLEGCE